MTKEEAIQHLENIIIFSYQDGYSDKAREALKMAIKALEQEPKTGHCKDCKWWKDSNGAYRRGIEAESQCPINRREVFEGNGYCYMYEPQESECSRCKASNISPFKNFCPNCGADMRGEVEE